MSADWILRSAADRIRLSGGVATLEKVRRYLLGFASAERRLNPMRAQAYEQVARAIEAGEITELPKARSLEQIALESRLRLMGLTLAEYEAGKPRGTRMTDDFYGDELDYCPECGGEGVVYCCLDEIGCVDPESGCDLCERRCDHCRPVQGGGHG